MDYVYKHILIGSFWMNVFTYHLNNPRNILSGMTYWTHFDLEAALMSR